MIFMRQLFIVASILLVKRFFVYILLAFFAFHIAGYLAVFKIRQWRINAEMDKSQRNIESFVVSIRYYHSHLLRQGKEIIWQGKLYDIKTKRFSHNKVYLKAIKDTKEHSLIGQLANFLKAKDKNGDAATKSFSKLLKLEFLTNRVDSKFFGFSLVKYPNQIIKKPLSGFLGFISPPPQLG